MNENVPIEKEKELTLRANIEHQKNIITTILQARLKNAVAPKFHKCMLLMSASQMLL